jgi:hypothetical protein
MASRSSAILCDRDPLHRCFATTNSRCASFRTINRGKYRTANFDRARELRFPVVEVAAWEMPRACASTAVVVERNVGRCADCSIIFHGPHGPTV